MCEGYFRRALLLNLMILLEKRKFLICAQCLIDVSKPEIKFRFLKLHAVVRAVVKFQETTCQFWPHNTLVYR